MTGREAGLWDYTFGAIAAFFVYKGFSGPADEIAEGAAKHGDEVAKGAKQVDTAAPVVSGIKDLAGEFAATQKAWKALPKNVRDIMHGITHGTRPLSDFTNLPANQQETILNYYRATAANASKPNAEAVRQLNQHRIDFLTGLHPDPPGGIGNFPK